MEQPGERNVSSGVQNPSPDYLIGSAVSVVLACIASGEAKEGQVVPLLKDVHDGLLDIARSSRDAGMDIETVARGFLGRSDPPPPAIAIEEVMREMGVSFVSALLVEGEPETAQPREVSAEIIPEASSARADDPQAPEPSAELLEAAEPEVEPMAPAGPDEPEPVVETPPAAAEAVAPARAADSVRGKASAKKKKALQSAPPAAPAARSRKQARPQSEAAAPAVKEPRLPKGISSIEEALRMNGIVCLEDGRRVKDLGAHLAAKGISEEDYRKKWDLPAEYPMQAPSAILARGQTYEVDFATGLFRPVRA